MNSKADAGLDPERLPAHVAIIMDGNGRWAKKRMMNRIRGHERGVEVVREIVRATRRVDIPVLTLYAFSTENWARPKTEIAALMMILKRFLKSEEQEMMDNNIRLNTIGRTGDLPHDVQQALRETMSVTSGNTAMILNLALSYGGRSEIVRMVQAIAEKAKNGEIEPSDITEEMVSDHLYTQGMPDPDIMIRTSGEMRISNFLLWQLAYAEFFITDTLWPDFSKEEYYQILRNFQKRDRRFGKVKP